MRRTKEAAAQTRESILDAAERVFFERGVARTTLEQVARTAAVTRGAVYWHFKNKADLFNAVIERIRLPLESAFYQGLETADTVDDLEALCTNALIDLHHDNRLRRVYTVLFLKCEHTEEMEETIAREHAVKMQAISSLRDFFGRLQKTGRIRAADEPGELARALYAYMLGLHIDYLRSPELYRIPGDAETLVGYFFAPLKPA